MVQTVKRVALYCRVSTGDQNCDRQERDLRAFAERIGCEIIGVYKETASGAKNNRKVRKEVIALAQSRKIDSILITELSRWGRSTSDLLDSLQELAAYNVSLVAQTGNQFDLSTAQGKMIAGVLAVLAEFERDLVKERTLSGLAAAREKGRIGGRRKGFNPSDKVAPKVLKLIADGHSYREIADRLNISKTTVVNIVKRSA